MEAIRTQLPWLLSAITIWMTVLAGNKHRLAWAVGLGNQALWLFWIVASSAWGFLPMNIALWVVYGRNHLKWRRGTESKSFPLRMRAERERGSLHLRVWWNWIECAYVVFAVRGLKAEVEFPSDWHEHRMGWVHLGFGFMTVAFAFPWPWVVPDDGQCSGPRYGFAFFGDKFWLYFGKDTGRSRDPRRYVAIAMPWEWRHRKHEVLGEPEQHPYRYVLRSGKVQERTATIKAESRLWTRPWLPHRRVSSYIGVEFSDEVGERTGSWKGGTLGCGYEMKPGETPHQTLMRMERERKF